MKKTFYALFLVLIAASCADNKSGDEPSEGKSTPSMSFSVINTYPHDTSSYTQGLLIYKGSMYEGTGNWGFSRLLKVDLATGKALQQISLDKKYFGEGVTILRDTVYQLTYKEHKVFVYTLSDFRKIKEYDVNFEGWGLTNDGQSLIVSTGGSDLLYFNPSDFTLQKSQTVTEGGMPSYKINELEYIDGFIYANQYEYPYILKINPATGEVVAKADVTSIWDRVKRLDPAVDVPNGIAYDADTHKIYITGKWWPELYEVSFGR